MSDPATAVSAAPVVAVLQPYIDAVVVSLVGVAVSYAVALLHKLTGVQISQANAAALDAEVERQAGYAIAKAEGNLAGLAIDAHSPQVKAAADYLVANLPRIIGALGKSPDDVAHMIASAIGDRQVKMPAAPPAAAAPPS